MKAEIVFYTFREINIYFSSFPSSTYSTDISFSIIAIVYVKITNRS